MVNCGTDTGQMGAEGRYVVAGRDLEEFTMAWLADLEGGGGHGRGLLDEGPDFSVPFLTSNIAHHANDEKASDETVLLDAVLLVHYVRLPDEARPMGPPLDGWAEIRAYVAEAFDTVREMGDSAAAGVLIGQVLKKMSRETEPTRWASYLRKRQEDDPRRGIWLDQELAKISQRQMRAAHLFDPAIDFDAAVLAYNRT